VHIDAISVREIRLRLKAPFETSFGILQKRRILLVEVKSDGATGWGEVTAVEGPFYNSETTDTAWIILRDFIIPLVLGKEVASATEIPTLVAPVRGHEMAKAAVENAIWDLEAQQKKLPLAVVLGGRMEEIACGVSIGINRTVDALVRSVETELAAGYQRIKIKIKPGNDQKPVRTLRQHFPNIKLMVDANSAYGLRDIAHLREFDEYDLMMIEQPLAWDDFYQHAHLQTELQTPICLDESIHNLGHTEAAIAMKSCRVLNIKLGRVGGHTEARRIEEFCRQNQIPVWCGGMLESGIGRAHNIAMSALPGFILPGDVSASQRYWDEDIIEPEVEVTQQGTIQVPTSPGLGYQVARKRVDSLTERQETFTANPTVTVM
jgi:O-succinylbenzoate synthase